MLDRIRTDIFLLFTPKYEVRISDTETKQVYASSRFWTFATASMCFTFLLTEGAFPKLEHTLINRHSGKVLA